MENDYGLSIGYGTELPPDLPGMTPSNRSNSDFSPMESTTLTMIIEELAQAAKEHDVTISLTVSPYTTDPGDESKE